MQISEVEGEWLPVEPHMQWKVFNLFLLSECARQKSDDNAILSVCDSVPALPVVFRNDAHPLHHRPNGSGKVSRSVDDKGVLVG